MATVKKEKASRPSPFQKKLDSLRMRLLEDLSIDELQRLKVQTDLLENVLSAATNYHHHDTNEHHDHETLVASPVDERVQPAKTKQNG